MEIAYGVIVVLHLIGMAGVVGGWMSAVRAPRILPAIVYGSILAVLTGLVLVGLSEAVYNEGLNYAKITVKLLVALVIAVLAWVNRNRDAVPNGLLHLIGLLGLANVSVAVLWN